MASPGEAAIGEYAILTWVVYTAQHTHIETGTPCVCVSHSYRAQRESRQPLPSHRGLECHLDLDEQRAPQTVWSVPIRAERARAVRCEA